MAAVGIKIGVQPYGLVRIIVALCKIAPQITAVEELVITAAINGEHGPNSWHYALRAIDLRTKNFPSATSIRQFIVTLQAELGPNFQILYEGEGTDNAHLHIAYRPQ
jgi:hypothetical protein